MIEVVPAILPKSWDELVEEVERVRPFAKSVQIDIVDGHFAKGKTWPYKDRDTFDTIIKQEHGLPHWEEVDFEFDLMINDPAVEVKHYAHAGASRLVLHAASPGVAAALNSLSEMREEGGEYTIKAGVALAAHAGPHDLEGLEQPDFVQVMGIEHEGRQGEPFDPDKRALFLIERLRRMYPTMPIQVDGGVRAENIKMLVDAGATRIIAGSAILKADDPQAAYQELVRLANSQ
ncbi:hypothetical protein EXS62_02445 [Candidatus Kaiserbacteria bacterium]|nr:hypothetical protein [Candidatus Kaiserbacteria bacterium]